MLADKDGQTQDRVVVGVVYRTCREKSQRSFRSLQWEMTDLSVNDARTLSLRLVHKALLKFEQEEGVDVQVGRGSIIAVMNAELLPNTSHTKGAPPLLQVGLE